MVGLHAAFHDRETYPLEVDTEGTIFMAPGYEYNVLVQPKKYNRKTEHIGKCLSQFPMYLVKPNYYVQQLCQQQCLMETVWRKCRCPYIFFKPIRTAFARYFGLKVEDIPPNCWMDDIKTQRCTKKLMENG